MHLVYFYHIEAAIDINDFETCWFLQASKYQCFDKLDFPRTVEEVTVAAITPRSASLFLKGLGGRRGFVAETKTVGDRAVIEDEIDKEWPTLRCC